jgi:hypothetical protein
VKVIIVEWSAAQYCGRQAHIHCDGINVDREANRDVSVVTLAVDEADTSASRARLAVSLEACAGSPSPGFDVRQRSVGEEPNRLHNVA